MALDKEYFDSIHIDVVKKKYYNAHKVEAVFDDIRSQAELLMEENRSMHDQLDTLNGTKFEIGDAILTAQKVYKELVDKANDRAKAIIADAERQSDEIINEAKAQQEYAIQRVEHCYSRIREQHMAAIDSINAEWQEFLCGLYPEDDSAAEKAGEAVLDKKDYEELPPDELPEEEYFEETENLHEISYEDIESKVGAIAKELFSDF